MAAAVQIEPVGTELRPLRFPPELELLFACSQPVTDREPGLAVILASPLDWDRVLRLASQHRLVPALFLTLHGRDDVPASIRSVIHARFENQERRALRFTAELAHIVRHFDSHGIQILAYKGAALGQLLYGDPAMRHFGDLDFLVRAADVPRARSALQELGYVPKFQPSPRQEKEYLRSGYEYVFGLKADRNLVEIQWQIVPRFYAINFDMNALFARSIQLNLEGLPLRTLGREDLLLVLCVHAAKHEWAQLGMVRDIATLARRDLDWAWIDAEARRLGIVKILAVSMSLAGSLCSLDIAAPPTFQAEMCSVKNISAAIQRNTISCAEPETESLRYFRAMMHLRERWQDRMRLAWRLAVTPSVGEWQALRIPNPLFSLYRGVRILRLLKRFCLSAKPHPLPASPTE